MNSSESGSNLLNHIQLDMATTHGSCCRSLRGKTFVDALSAYALASSAVSHPYLDAFKKGEHPCMSLAIQDFAYQYGIYSAKFISYVDSVINQLSNPSHQTILRENLNEEKGHTDESHLPIEIAQSVQGTPHAVLYKRFQTAVGVDQDYKARHRQCQFAVLWSKHFKHLCDMDECVAVGAIGIGTELLVAHIYRQILEGLVKHSHLSLSERVFFDLHSHCDTEHAAQLAMIATELATNQDACEKIEYGVKAALYLRITFWDKMLERANRQ